MSSKTTWQEPQLWSEVYSQDRSLFGELVDRPDTEATSGPRLIVES
jgi:hypothetical protein